MATLNYWALVELFGNNFVANGMSGGLPGLGAREVAKVTYIADLP